MENINDTFVKFENRFLTAWSLYFFKIILFGVFTKWNVLTCLLYKFFLILNEHLTILKKNKEKKFEQKIGLKLFLWKYPFLKISTSNKS